jgi:two-component system LytT family response regulator
MRVLIADDEAPARARLRRLLTHEIDVEVVGECATGRDAAAMIRRTGPDLVFLDIEMPGLDGFGVVDAVREAESPQIVFVTAYDNHALRAFDVGAVDYLLKPFTPVRFQLVLERARARMKPPAAVPVAAAVPRAPLRRLLVQQEGRARFIDVQSIDRADADRNYVEISVATERFRLRTTIGALAERLDPALFLRLNRSTIARVDTIREMHEWSHGDYRALLKDGSTIIWSRRYRAASREFVIDG